MRGREAFAAASQAGLSHFRIEGKSDIQEIQIFGDVAWLWTHLSITVIPRNGGLPLQRSGNTLSVFRRESTGNWLLVRDANMLTLEPAVSV